jgi:hypothetical protein
VGAVGPLAGIGAAVTLTVPLLLTGLIGVTAAAGVQPNPVTLGPGVPEEYRDDMLAAAEECPRIHPSVLAAQIAVESNWNPHAVSTAGARGIAQLVPEAWATWGGDLDEDGTASSFDPGDAIRTQGRYLCHLLDTVLAAGLGTGDQVETISLALAAYRAGPDAVGAQGLPNPIAARDYVSRIWTLATSPDYGLGLAADTDTLRSDLPAGGVDAMLPDGYRNGRTAEQSVAYALTQVGVWRDAGYCLRFVGRVVYQRPWDGGSIDYAYQVWDNAPASMHNARDFDAPHGAIVLWSSRIGSGAGHIAISLGNGKMITTTRGAIAISRIRGFADHAYLGWMPPYFRSGARALHGMQIISQSH